MTPRQRDGGPPQLLASTPYALHDLALPRATVEGREVPAPRAFAAARARFDAARAAYHGARYGDAAVGFLAAARTLPRDPTSGADPLAAARVAAYRNAAHALVLADDRPAARAALAPLVDDDPACAGPLRALLASLADG